jgi:RHS repeat-associated protein
LITSYEYYSKTHLLKKTIDEFGVITDYKYDKLMRLTATRNKVKPDNSAVVLSGTQYVYKNGTTIANNFIKTLTSYEAGGTTQNYQFMDGLGRPVQDIKYQHSPNTSSVAVPGFGNQNVANDVCANTTIYDANGRASKTYFPFEVATNAADAVYSALPSGQPNTRNIYDNSPLNRVIEQFTNDGLSDKSSVKTDYSSNIAADSVLYYNELGVKAGKYPANSLFKTMSTDANGNITAIFTDKIGRTILSRRYATPLNSLNGLETYAVYDNYGDKIGIVPPGAVDINDSLSFRYWYDTQHRLSQKHIPSTIGRSTYLYDDRDFMVMMQDPNLRAKNKYIGTLYDAFGRVTSTGFINATTSTAALSAYAAYSSGTGYPDSLLLQRNTYEAGKSRITYTKTKILEQATAPRFLEQNIYYDVYNRPIRKAGNNIANLTNLSAETDTLTYNGRDQVIQTSRKHIGLGGVTQYLRDDYFYDAKGRQLQHYNRINNGAMNLIGQTNYTFRDEIKEKNFGSPVLQSVDYTYDFRGWLTSINGGTDRKVSNGNMPYYNCNDYSPSLLYTTPPTPIAIIATGDTKPDLFMEELHYDDLVGNGTLYPSTGIPKNGNIACIIYQTYGQQRQAYGFKYDAFDRMLEAKHGNYDDAGTFTATARYDEILTYDKRGNINTLKRYGLKDPACTLTNSTNSSQKIPTYTYGLIDDLQYGYLQTNKNRLASVTDASDLNRGFKNPTSATQLYTYDNNGNITKEPYKTIASIEYYFNNLPKQVTYTDGSKISWWYDANGVKLRKFVQPAAVRNLPKSYNYYFRGIEVGDSLGLDYKVYLPEGRLVKRSTPLPNGVLWDYEFTITDHLGNARVQFSDKNGNQTIEPATEILQINHYYPFGLNQEGAWAKGGLAENKYQYNGKELNTELGLDLEDYGGRWYNPALGRWVEVDPMGEEGGQESWNPYHYTFGNPVNNIDPDGKNPIAGIVGAALEYGTQVATNAVQGNPNPFTSNINVSAIVIAGVEGFVTSGASVGKTIAVKVGAALVNNAVEVKWGDEKGGSGLHTTTKSVKETIKGAEIDLVMDAVAGKVGNLAGSGAKKLAQKVGLNNGSVSQGIKQVIRETGGKVTREVNNNVKKTVKEAGKNAISTVSKLGESSAKVTTDKARSALKDRAKDKQP